MHKKKDCNSPQEEGDNMALVLKKEEITLKEMLKRISSNAKFLTGKDNMIELDPNNPLHKEWFEKDK